MNMQPCGVIFDMDGVLLDTCAAHCRTWQQMATESGQSLTEEEFSRLFGQTSLEIAKVIWSRNFSHDEIVALELRKEKVFRDAFRQNAVFIPGVRELIARIQAAGIPIGIGSSAIRDNVNMAIDLLGLAGKVVSVSCSDVARAKPAPDIFLRAAELLHLAPSQCVVIEDSRFGWAAAAAAGMACIAYVDPSRGSVDSSLATITIHNYADVTVELIRRLAA